VHSALGNQKVFAQKKNSWQKLAVDKLTDVDFLVLVNYLILA
jgi:hypothetical protein